MFGHFIFSSLNWMKSKHSSLSNWWVLIELLNYYSLVNRLIHRTERCTFLDYVLCAVCNVICSVLLCACVQLDFITLTQTPSFSQQVLHLENNCVITVFRFVPSLLCCIGLVRNAAKPDWTTIEARHFSGVQYKNSFEENKFGMFFVHLIKNKTCCQNGVLPNCPGVYEAFCSNRGGCIVQSDIFNGKEIIFPV